MLSTIIIPFFAKHFKIQKEAVYSSLKGFSLKQ